MTTNKAQLQVHKDAERYHLFSLMYALLGRNFSSLQMLAEQTAEDETSGK